MQLTVLPLTAGLLLPLAAFGASDSAKPPNPAPHWPHPRTGMQVSRYIPFSITDMLRHIQSGVEKRLSDTPAMPFPAAAKMARRRLAAPTVDEVD